MITIQNRGNLVNVAVLGEFTLSDYKEFEEAVLYSLRFQGKVNLLLDFRDMTGYTVDVVWEEIRFSRAHTRDFEKVAVVTSDQWMIWSAWLSRLFVDADIQIFEDYAAALVWVEEDASAA